MRVLVVDGMNLIRRVHAAVTATVSATEADDDGEATVSACTASLSKLLNRQQPSHAICVMDSPPPSWRHREFPDYKANRDPMPEQLSVILPRLEDAFRERGVRSVSEEGFEADDVIATIALRVASSGGRVAIVSTDKSFCSLIREGISVYDHFSDRYLDTEYVRQRFDVEPAQLVTFFALTGNASLNVPGVRSVGSSIRQTR